MCDICNHLSLRSRKLNGDKPTNLIVRFYNVRYGRSVDGILCYYHNIELFKMGEPRFLTKHPYMLRNLGVSPYEAAFSIEKEKEKAKTVRKAFASGSYY